MKTKTKTLFAALAAATAVAALAAPAAAQDYGDRYDHGRYDNSRYDNSRYDNSRYDNSRYGQGRWDSSGYDINHRQMTIERSIYAGVRAGSLTRREAWNLRAEFQDIARLEARYRIDGLNGYERADLDRRLDRLQAQIRHDRTDRDDRRYGYGYGDSSSYRR